MIERFRPRFPPPAPAPRRKAKPLTFVCLPNAILRHPPIRHRGALPEVGLSALEFAIAGACISLARAKLATARHEYALRVGKGAIRASRDKPLRNLDMMSAREQFEAVGSGNYERGRFRFSREHNDKEFSVQCSPGALLRLAGLTPNGKNYARVTMALRRLTRTVGKFAPVLKRWERAPDGKLHLHVEGRWVPRQRFARVPWPAPTAGAGVLALYLFLHGADLRRNTTTSIGVVSLYRKLGIPLAWPAHSQRTLDRALDQVNEHLRRLNENGRLDEFGLPAAFEIVTVDDGDRLRFRKSDRAPDWGEDDEGNDEVERERQKQARRAAPARREQSQPMDGRDDEDKLVELENQEREQFRKSLGLAWDEYLDDDEIDCLRSQQQGRREVVRRRQQEESNAAQFQAITAKLKAPR